MDIPAGDREQYAHAARYLAGRRASILDRWRAVVHEDPALRTASTLRRAQFYDHIPVILETLERELAGLDASATARRAGTGAAASHGKVRWQQGYCLAEVLREWAHLQRCLLDEVTALADEGGCDAHVLLGVHRIVARLCSEGVIEAAAEYRRLEETAAAGRLADLEHALAQLREVDRVRSRLWHEAAHDLRGNVGVVRTAATALDFGPLTEEQREQSLRLLRSGIDALAELLEDLMQLARLEAGREERVTARFDAGTLLHGLATGLRPIAERRGLFLRAEGPSSLAVQGDAVKTRRIAQNLLLNALRYTTRGGVLLEWSAGASPDASTWSFRVLDTGPGFVDEAVPPLTDALREATQEGRATGIPEAGPAGRQSLAPPTLPAQSPGRDGPGTPGEGVGLSIVKRLCELLDATLELDTAPGRGTTVRVTLPRLAD